jgi:hypothetical protein
MPPLAIIITSAVVSVATVATWHGIAAIRRALARRGGPLPDLPPYRSPYTAGSAAEVADFAGPSKALSGPGRHRERPSMPPPDLDALDLMQDRYSDSQPPPGIPPDLPGKYLAARPPHHPWRISGPPPGEPRRARPYARLREF